MSLTGRFTALFLSVLGLVLVGFSLALYISAQAYLRRQLSERLSASLAVLAAAVEIHPQGVEWEPLERVIPLGEEPGPGRLRWMVFDSEGNRIDHSLNLVDSELTPEWAPRPGTARLPARLLDRGGRPWSVSQRTISPGPVDVLSTKSSVAEHRPAEPWSSELLHPSLVLTVCAPLGPVDAALTALGCFLAAMSLGIWLLSAGLCRRLSRTALAPLTRLAESARCLDATDPGWCLDVAGTGDEVDELGGAFNDLLARLHVAFESQRRFSSDASHQLRTPLTVLIGQLQVALRQERSAQEYQTALNAALARACQLAQIVESLLFLSRLDGQATLPDLELLELNQWAAQFLASRSLARPEPEVVLHVAHDRELWIRAHSALLTQLVENLLDNARKYGMARAPIVVETVSSGDHAVLAVEDCGPGIPEADLPHIFEPFYRSPLVRRQGIPGVGLGLAIVERIATGLGASIEARSGSGPGTRFVLRFPLVKPVSPAKYGPDGVAMSANQCKLRSPFQAEQAPAAARDGSEVLSAG